MKAIEDLFVKAISFIRVLYLFWNLDFELKSLIHTQFQVFAPILLIPIQYYFDLRILISKVSYGHTVFSTS